MVEQASRAPISLVLADVDGTFLTADKVLTPRAEATLRREQWTVKFAPTIVSSLEELSPDVVKIVGISDDYDLLARCEKDVGAALGAAASAVRSQPYYLDVTHPEANKGTVVTTLSKLLSVPVTQIATSRQVQAQANLVTASNADDGFVKAIEQFILRRDAASRLEAQ
jgi:hydroxymethylpyrimidine pyrophosphatase-like HAD family hydrolase